MIPNENKSLQCQCLVQLYRSFLGNKLWRHPLHSTFVFHGLKHKRNQRLPLAGLTHNENPIAAASFKIHTKGSRRDTMANYSKL